MNNSWLGYAVIIVLFLLFAGGVWLLLSMIQSGTAPESTPIQSEEQEEEIGSDTELTPKMFEEFIYSQ